MKYKKNKLIKKQIPFKTASKKMKYLGKNLTKYVKALYSENYEIMINEIEDDKQEMKDILHS